MVNPSNFKFGYNKKDRNKIINNKLETLKIAIHHKDHIHRIHKSNNNVIFFKKKTVYFFKLLNKIHK